MTVQDGRVGQGRPLAGAESPRPKSLAALLHPFSGRSLAAPHPAHAPAFPPYGFVPHPQGTQGPPRSLDPSGGPEARHGRGRRGYGDGLALAGLLLLVAWQLWPAAGPGRLPQNLDLMLQYVPNAAYVQRSLAEGRLPLWNPYLGTGMPFAADPGTGTWYLPHWPLLLALPLEGAVRVILWGHLFLAATGMYTWLRTVARVGPVPAWIGSASFALTTWLPGLAGMPVVLTAVAWLPWVLWLGHRAAREGGWWVAGLAVAGALQALAGWPAGAYLTWLALGVLAVFLAAGLAGLARLALAAALAAGLAAVLLVPAAEFVAQTSYTETRPLTSVASDGYLTLLSWFRPAGGKGGLESSQLYLGLAPLVLVMTALAGGWRRLVLACAALALLALLLASGTRTPLFPALYQWLPGFRIIYLPARLGVVAAFALAALAALGAQAVTTAPWNRRRTGLVVAMCAVSGLAVLGQFWLSEGYDDFRRLLTNLGRATGGPFLTREQELHYLLFGLLALLAVAGATILPRRVTAGLLLALTLADLGLAQWRSAPQSFEPRSWYGAAHQAAARAAGEPGLAAPDGHERLLGLQWHGRTHFLTDFPRSASPELLPPNLALLAGVRDAQAYNPLLLRRAVEYYGRLNLGALDDHWLRVANFRSPLVDALAVRLILTDPASGAEWRLAVPLLPRGVALPPNGTLAAVWGAGAPGDDGMGEPPPTRQVHVVSYLGEATHVPQGTPAVELRFAGKDAHGGDAETVAVLRAGEGTAEWAFGRPDVRASVQHRQEPVAVALETRLVGAVSGTFTVFEYLATVDLEAPLELRDVRARSLLPGVPAFIQALYVVPAGDSRFERTATGVVDQQAGPRATFDGGRVEWLTDRPELIELRVTAEQPGTLVLADAIYPGWVATVDGVPVPIVPADGLFRSLSLDQGQHRVAFVYQPRSLQAGLAVSGLALLGVLLVPRLERSLTRRLPGRSRLLRQPYGGQGHAA